MWFLYYHFSGILFVMLLKIHSLAFVLSYVMRKYQFLPKMIHWTILYIIQQMYWWKNMAAYQGHIQSLLYKKVYSVQVLSYIIYKKLMPPTTAVWVGVGGKIMVAVFYVLWAIKKWWCITRGRSLITLHVYTLRSPINSALFFFSLLF